jgi:hypothetical protein
MEYGKGRLKKVDTGKFRDIYPKFDIQFPSCLIGGGGFG